MKASDTAATHDGIAIVGMAGRFPGDIDVRGLWDLLLSGHEAVRDFTDEELRAAGMDPAAATPGHVRRGGALTGIEDFDAAFFGIAPDEARLMDPQHRVFLECVWQALEDAGCPPTVHGERTAVFGTCSQNSYLLRNVLRSEEFRGREFAYPVLLGSDKDYLCTRVSYRLDLRGPSMTVQSACSSSLIALHLAVQALVQQDCDVAIAGGVSIMVPQTAGYTYQEGGSFSRDGHCRPFDADATGMVPGSGCGVVVLKRLPDAVTDRDHIYAVIRATAVNNDGATKPGFTAPSITGQARAISTALERSAVAAGDIAFIEAHGTGTRLGDPIEFMALSEAYGRAGGPAPACALGSVKANLGHLDAAAGITGLIKTALVLSEQTIPPQINYARPNPALNLAATPFTVHTRLHRSTVPLEAAAVSSVGMGGTNAHCVLSRAPGVPARPAPPPGPYSIAVSGRTEAGLRQLARQLADHLDRHPDARIDDLALSLRTRRTHPLAVRLTATSTRHLSNQLTALAAAPVLPPTDGPGPVGADDRPGNESILAAARKVSLPPTVFDRHRFWIDPAPDSPAQHSARPSTAGEPSSYAQVHCAVVETITSVWPAPELKDDDDLWEQGMSSLTMLEIAARLQSRLQHPVSVDDLARLRTIGRLSEHLNSASAGNDSGQDSGPIIPIRPDGEGPAMFLVHPAAGTVTCFAELARHSYSTNPLFALRHQPGPDRSESVERLAARYVEHIRRLQPHGPYLLGGYSFGGLVALEMALQLQRAGESVAHLIAFDTATPGQGSVLGAFNRSDARRILTDPALAPASTEGGAITRRPEEAEAASTAFDELLDTWEGNQQLAALYRPSGRFTGALTLVQATELWKAATDGTSVNGDTEPELDYSWAGLTTRPPTVVRVAANHFTLLQPDGAARASAQALDQALACTDTHTQGRGQQARTKAQGRKKAAPVAVMFPGQGIARRIDYRQLRNQAPDLVADAETELGRSLDELLHEGSPGAWLGKTTLAQPLIYTANAVAYRTWLREHGRAPDALLGHSLGEFNALHAASVFDFRTGLRIVIHRAHLMARVQGAMLAVQGLPAQELLEALQRTRLHSVDVACFNAPTRYVLAGRTPRIRQAQELLAAETNARTHRLITGGPYHSRHMRATARRFGGFLTTQHLAQPRLPVLLNRTGRPDSPSLLATDLAEQIDHPVLWSQSLRWLLARQYTLVEPEGTNVLTQMSNETRHAFNPARTDLGKKRPEGART
ncbi:beta-ketoacyl synthase N-terminal-like domain-containing protein [Streptomyces sp. NPDC002659]|uniref:beta-ketoacyl synthase N-terminal-like domain-containing protein n=1 Tax=Streptomyces sp. NPDC002659 TaxID=3364656 RepID=UPI0036885FD4